MHIKNIVGDLTGEYCGDIIKEELQELVANEEGYLMEVGAGLFVYVTWAVPRQFAPVEAYYCFVYRVTEERELPETCNRPRFFDNYGDGGMYAKKITIMEVLYPTEDNSPIQEFDSVPEAFNYGLRYAMFLAPPPNK